MFFDGSSAAGLESDMKKAISITGKHPALKIGNPLFLVHYTHGRLPTAENTLLSLACVSPFEKKLHVCYQKWNSKIEYEMKWKVTFEISFSTNATENKLKRSQYMLQSLLRHNLENLSRDTAWCRLSRWKLIFWAAWEKAAVIRGRGTRSVQLPPWK